MVYELICKLCLSKLFQTSVLFISTLSLSCQQQQSEFAQIYKKQHGHMVMGQHVYPKHI